MFRKRDNTAHPRTLLDLTEKANRKVAPLQFHHAYSIHFFRPENSPLRQEVEDLWNQREEKVVIDQLARFIKINEHSDRRLGFHNTVMRWKCSLLTDEERQEHQNWIEEHVLEKEEEIK